MSESAGFDVSKEETSFCVKDASGRVLAQGEGGDGSGGAVLGDLDALPGRRARGPGDGDAVGAVAPRPAGVGRVVCGRDSTRARRMRSCVFSITRRMRTTRRSGGDLADGFLSPRVGEERVGASGPGPAEVARASGAPEAGHAEHDPRASGFDGRPACEGKRPVFGAGSGSAGWATGVACGDRAAAVVVRLGAGGVAVGGRGRGGAGEGGGRLPIVDDRSGSGAGDGAGVRLGGRGAGALREVARGGGLCGSGVAALAIRGGGPFGPHLAARRRDVAQPSLRVCELPAGAGAARASVEGLGAAGEEADRPQEGARGAGAPAGGGPAPHDGRRRGVPLARSAPCGGPSAGGGKGSPVDMRASHSAPCPHVHRRNDKEEILDPEGKKVLRLRASGESRPRRDGGLGDPVSWVASRSPRDPGMRGAPWDANVSDPHHGASRTTDRRRLRRQPCPRRNGLEPNSGTQPKDPERD